MPHGHLHFTVEWQPLEVPKPGTLQVHVKGGSGLKLSDANGEARPKFFVQLEAGTAQEFGLRRTSAVTQTADPVWDEYFEFDGDFADLVAGKRLTAKLVAAGRNGKSLEEVSDSLCCNSLRCRTLSGVQVRIDHCPVARRLRFRWTHCTRRGALTA